MIVVSAEPWPGGFTPRRRELGMLGGAGRGSSRFAKKCLEAS